MHTKKERTIQKTLLTNLKAQRKAFLRKEEHLNFQNCNKRQWFHVHLLRKLLRKKGKLVTPENLSVNEYLQFKCLKVKFNFHRKFMSSIDKLALRGIRSFSPFDEEKIEFFKPLTLILGQNGAGKTTIIEALRSMTSGTMPPHTNNGKTFIHDPRVSNLPETKASIKLKFNTIKGKPVFAMRSFQLMNKK